MSVKQKIQLNEVWEISNQKWDISKPVNESRNIEGNSIIGIVEGQFFVPDGVSRNDRFYSKTLWERILGYETIKERLGNLIMYGRIGHDDRAVDDDDLNYGKVSHVMEKLWIDGDGRGMGRALIINTQAGQNLRTFLDLGSKLKVSSRASGGFLENEKHNGLPIVDPTSYILETFDFVIDPGFIETNPTLIKNEEVLENKNNVKTTNNNRRKDSMPQDLLIKELKEQKDKAVAKNDALLQENSNLQSRMKSLEEKTSLAESKNELSEKVLKEYRTLGTSKEIFETTEEAIKRIDLLKKEKSEGFQKLYNELKEYKELSSVEDLKKIKEIEEKADGSVEEMFKVLEKCERFMSEYKSFGSPQRIKGILRENLKYKKIGTPIEIIKSIKGSEKCLEKYLEFGKYSEVKELFEIFEKNIKRTSKLEKNKTIIELSKKFDLPMESVAKLLENVKNPKKAGDIIKGFLEETVDNKSKSNMKPQTKRLAENKAEKKKFQREVKNETRSSAYFKRLRRV